MCIVVLAWQTVSNKPLILFGNRDEFYHRDAAPLSIWSNSPIIAGRDLQSGGTWLGITASGRWAIITNFRRKENPPPNAITRGALVADYLNGDTYYKINNPLHNLQRSKAQFKLLVSIEHNYSEMQAFIATNI